MEENCKTPEDFLKQSLKLKRGNTGNSDSNSSGFVYIIGAFGTIISLIIGCTCHRAFKKSPEPEPKESPPNPVPVNQVDDSSEQPHHPAPSLQPGQNQMDIVTPPETLGRPTPFSVNQRWNTNCGQPAPSSPQWASGPLPSFELWGHECVTTKWFTTIPWAIWKPWLTKISPWYQESKMTKSQIIYHAFRCMYVYSIYVHWINKWTFIGAISISEWLYLLAEFKICWCGLSKIPNRSSSAGRPGYGSL